MDGELGRWRTLAVDDEIGIETVQRVDESSHRGGGWRRRASAQWKRCELGSEAYGVTLGLEETVW